MMNESVDLQDLTLTNLPKGKKLIVFSYGNIYQNETNFNIAMIFKELYKEKPEYFVRYLNLKEMFAFPLGTVIDNQHKIGTNAGQLASFQINIEKGLLETKKIREIPSLKRFMDELPKKIGNYSMEWHKNQQNYSTFIDNWSGQTIIFPHYEIARYFYFTSSSMTRQIMAGSLHQNALLDGLYKKASLDKGNGEIYLKFNANSNDAENIFRFVVDKQANNMWYQVRRDLTVSRINIAEEKRKHGFVSSTPEMMLQANFPTSGVVNFRVRARVLDDGSLLVLRILQENTFYPFTKLRVIREFLNGKEDVVGVIKRKAPVKKNLTNKVNTATPNNAYEPVNVIDKDDDDDLEIKLDLLNKVVEFETKIEEDEDKETTKKTDESEQELDLSPNDAEGQGDLNTAEEHLKEERDNEEEDTKDYITLEDLKKMLLYCADEYEEFSYKILKYEYLPQKPEDYKGRYVWKRSRMSDEKTPRKYIAVEIKYKNSKYVIIEIEKDKINDALSTLVIKDKNSNIDEYIINEIAMNIAKTSNSWLQGLDLEITKNYLYHPHERSEEKIQDWGKRLIDIIKEGTI